MSDHCRPHIASNRNRHRMRPRRERAPQRERARIVARLIAAERTLPADPDRAALLLDGALAQLLDLWAGDVRLSLPDAPDAPEAPDALSALEAAAPAVAWRVRLALQAHEPSARLAHCWALLDLLTPTTRCRPTPCVSSTAWFPTSQSGLSGSFRTIRTNGASHVS